MTKAVKMNNKLFFKNVLDQCKKGEFKETLELIIEYENCSGKLDHSFGMKLLISCCNACVNNPKCISVEHLYKLLQLIIPIIRNPNETDLLSYIQSIYHILNMLVRKNCYNVIVEMENILLPPFLPSTIPKKHRDTYNSIVIILHNFVAKCAVENIRNQNESLIRISKLISQICSKILGPIDLINKSYKCFSNLMCLNISVNEQKKYYTDTLLLVDSNKIQPKLEECFKYILGFSSIILNNILKTFDFKQAWEFCDSISSLLENNLIHEEYMYLVCLLKSCLVITPVKLKDKLQYLVKSQECMRMLDKIWEKSNDRPQVREKLMTLIQTITFYYKSHEEKEWIQFSEKLQLEILTFILNISNHRYIHIQIILGLIEMYAQFKSNSTSDYHRKCLQLLETFFNQINQLKQQHCEDWKKAWNILGIGVYNIGVHLNRSANEAALLYFNFLLKSYVFLESKNTKTYLKHPTLSNCLRVLCELHLSEPKKFLGYSALGLLLCSNTKEAFITGWVKLKHSLREDKSPGFEEIQKVTTVSALKMLQEEAPELVSDFNDSDKLNLLKFELQQYKKKWKSKLPVMAAVQEMCEICDLDGVVEAIVDIFGDHVLPLHENCLENFSNVLFKLNEKIKKAGGILSQVRLAILYHICYKYNMKQIITKNALDMEWTSIVPIKLPSGLIPRDPSEECDVVSSYESLTLDRFLCNLDNLDEALIILSKVIHELKATENLESISMPNLYDCLIQISYEYRLLRHRIRSLHASELALKIAQIQNSSAGIVQATSFVIEFADVHKGYPKRQIEMVDKLIGQADFLKECNLKTIMVYYICKSKALFSIDIHESYKIFKLAMELMDKQEDTEGFSAIKSQLYLLRFKFSSLPCELDIEIHRNNTLMDVYSATAVMFDEYKKNHFDNMSTNEREYDLSILLDASEELTRLYHLMKVPMEVRTYGRETFLLTQKLVLPLRCSTYLMYLAHADLMSSRLEDCQVKIDGLANILSLRESSKLARDCSNNSLDSELPTENPYMKEISLSSPKLMVQCFRLPAVTKHKTSCHCFYCICFEYQILVVEHTRLSALLSVKQNNLQIAQSFYEGALNLYDRYCNKWVGNANVISRFIHCDLLPEYNKEFLSPYGYTLLNFSSHMRRMKSKTEALNTNDKLISVLATNKLDHVFLYNEAIVQKLGYLTETLTIDPLQEIQNDMEFLSVNDQEELQKTPESKRTQISFPVRLVTPNFSPPKQPINKCLLFSLSPENPIENAGTSFKTRVQHFNMKTPAPKIQIYTDTSERKSRQKKSQCSISVKAGPSEENATVNTLACDTELGSAMKSRTRLLTEKLKQVSKKTEPSAGQSERKCQSKVSSSTKRLPIKKNLMMELASSDNEQSTARGGNVRKSARNKK